MKSSTITTSEWEVMKVIWENDFFTAGEIVKELTIEKNWAKTTINSFIQRLVEKGYISFRHTARYREYYALYTEKQCVVERMNDLTKSIYGSTLNLETKHFEFYGDNDTKYLKLLEKFADKGYERIIKILKIEPGEKQPVHLHTSQKRFHSVIGNPNGPTWHRASFLWGMIHMSPMDCFTDLSADKALMHVFTQLTLSEINENLPYYLHQGISAYLGQWMDKDRMKKALLENKGHNDIYTLRTFMFDIQNFRSNAGYELSYAFVSYMVSKFGLDSIRDMVDYPYDIPNLYNLNQETMVKEFREYINKKYL